MSRWFRVWQKKRGRRRTGSSLAGSVGEASFFGLLLLLGGIVQVYVFIRYTQAPSAVLLEPPVGFQFWLMVLISTSFLLIGGGGLVLTALQTGTSTERRAALVKRAADIDLINDELPSPSEHPGVPGHKSLNDSPGVELQYRLPVIQTQTLAFLATAFFCLVCNSIAIGLLVLLVREWVIGNLQIALIALTVFFGAMAGWSSPSFVRQLRMRAGIGATTLEISDHPLHPGNAYEVYLSQCGRLHLRSLEVLLVCEEEVTYRQGTDVRTERHVVVEELIYRGQDCQIRRDQPYEARCPLRISENIMHSFQGQHNVIQWKLMVRGQGTGWQSFERGFPVVIAPGVSE